MRGYSSYGTGQAKLGKNPFTIMVVVNGVEYVHAVYRVFNDQLLEVETNLVAFTTYIPFTLGTPRGEGGRVCQILLATSSNAF